MAVHFQYMIFVCIAGILLGNAQVYGDSSSMEYLIWPQANITKQDVDSVETFLKSLVTGPKPLYASKSAFAPMPAFWLAVLDQKSYQKVAAHPKVGEIGPNDVCDAEDVAPIRGKVFSKNITLPLSQRQPLESLDARYIIRERDPLPELRVISQAPNTPLSANPDYVYEIDDSQETFIYIGDFGINHGGYVTRIPQRIADRPDNLWGPIVVGAVNNEGEKASFSSELQHGRMLWAPGVEIECAAESPEIRIYWEESGTSFAAPLVAGVVAEKLTEMNRQGLFYPPLRNKYIYDNLQWKRPSGLPVIWNRMDGTSSALGVPSNSNETATA
ncbi:MAG: hypothetical protein Q9172_006366 [Xanthocarpia lactea]